MLLNEAKVKTAPTYILIREDDMILEGKDKDYYYIDRHLLPPISSKGFEIPLNKKTQRGFVGGKPILVLTLSGAVKFNFRRF